MTLGLIGLRTAQISLPSPFYLYNTLYCSSSFRSTIKVSEGIEVSPIFLFPLMHNSLLYLSTSPTRVVHLLTTLMNLY